MAIKIKYRDPKTTDFTKTDMVVNVKDGGLFYKSELGLHKLQEHNLNKHYYLQNFNNDWDENNAYWGNQRYIAWKGTETSNSNNSVLNQLLIPFDGILHKLFFRQTGSTSTTVIKLYINNNEKINTLYTNNVGNNIDYGDLNEIDINLDVKSGNMIRIALDAQSSPGIRLIFGQLLYSQTVNI